MNSKKLKAVNNFIEMLIKSSSIPEEKHIEIEDKVRDAVEDKIIKKENQINNIYAYIEGIVKNTVADYYRNKKTNRKLELLISREIINVVELSKPIYQIYEDKIRRKEEYDQRELRIASSKENPGFLGFVNSALFELLDNKNYNPVMEWIRREYVENKSNAKNLILLWLIFRYFVGSSEGDNIFVIWAMVLMQNTIIRIPSKKTFELYTKKRKIYDLKSKNIDYKTKDIAKLDEIKIYPSEVNRLYLKEIKTRMEVDKRIRELRDGYTEFEKDIVNKLILLKKIIDIKKEIDN